MRRHLIYGKPQELAVKLYGSLYRLRPLVPGMRSRPLHQEEGFAPFFIIGSGRSGNTLLRRVLMASGELHVPPESYVLGRVVRTYRSHSFMSWRELVYLILACFEYHREFGEFEISLRESAARLIELPQKQRTLATIINEIYCQHGRQFSPRFRRWGDKTPMNVYSLELIDQVFPDAQYIHILRDGFDVVASYLQAGLYKTAEGAARRWVDSVRLSQDFCRRHPDRSLEIRYEELVTEPETTAARACEFVGIEYDESILAPPEDLSRFGDVGRKQHHENVAAPISRASLGKGLEQLDPAELELVARIIGDQMRSCGYQLPALD